MACVAIAGAALAIASCSAASAAAVHVHAPLAAPPGLGAVSVAQFGMCQCPMTSSWFNAFCDGCPRGKPHMQRLVNFSQFYVGGSIVRPLSARSPPRKRDTPSPPGRTGARYQAGDA